MQNMLVYMTLICVPSQWRSFVMLTSFLPLFPPIPPPVVYVCVCVGVSPCLWVSLVVRRRCWVSPQTALSLIFETEFHCLSCSARPQQHCDQTCATVPGFDISDICSGPQVYLASPLPAESSLESLNIPFACLSLIFLLSSFLLLHLPPFLIFLSLQRIGSRALNQRLLSYIVTALIDITTRGHFLCASLVSTPVYDHTTRQQVTLYSPVMFGLR